MSPYIYLCHVISPSLHALLWLWHRQGPRSVLLFLLCAEPSSAAQVGLFRQQRAIMRTMMQLLQSAAWQGPISFRFQDQSTGPEACETHISAIDALGWL
jgi:hypothetical protein